MAAEHAGVAKLTLNLLEGSKSQASLAVLFWGGSAASCSCEWNNLPRPVRGGREGEGARRGRGIGKVFFADGYLRSPVIRVPLMEPLFILVFLLLEGGWCKVRVV